MKRRVSGTINTLYTPAKEAYYTPFAVAVAFLCMLSEGFLFKGQPSLLRVTVLELAALLPAAGVCIRLRGEGRERLRLRTFGIDKLLFLFLCAVSLLAGGLLITASLREAGFAWADISSLADISGFADSDTFSLLLAFAIIPAVCEELLFRSVLLSSFESAGGIFASILSSLLFAMFHFSVEKLPMYFFFGMMLSLVTLLTQSCVAAMLVHFLYNAFVLFEDSFLSDFFSLLEEPSFLVLVSLIILLACLALIFGECQRTYSYYAKQNREAPFYIRGYAGRAVAILFSPAFILCVVIFTVAVLI